MKRIVCLSVLFSCLLLLGCSRSSLEQKFREQVRLESFDGIDTASDGKLALCVTAKNGLSHKIKLLSADADVFLGDVLVFKVHVPDPVVLPVRSTTRLNIPVELSVKNPLKAIMLLPKLQSGKFDGVNISLDATVGVSVVKRKIHKEHVPATELMRMLKK